MTDIVTRLRRWTISTDAVPASDLMDEAADEIERLRSCDLIARGLLPVSGVFHWSCKTEKGRQRICVSCDLELPFPPAVGMCIDLGDDIPSPKIKEVVWLSRQRRFDIHGRVVLRDWGSNLFESLLNSLTAEGHEPELFDDNWMHS